MSFEADPPPPELETHLTEGRQLRISNFMDKLKSELTILPIRDALERALIIEFDIVSTYCKDSVAKMENLTDDQKALYPYIFMYTFDFLDRHPTECNPYYIINHALFSGETLNVERIKHLFYGLLAALKLLPCKKYTALYRGIKEKVDWRTDQTEFFPSFTSASQSLFVAQRFLYRSSKGDSGTLITLSDICGYDLKEFSNMNEMEVLILPCSSFIVTSVVTVNGDVIEVTMKYESGKLEETMQNLKYEVVYGPSRQEMIKDNAKRGDYEAIMEIFTSSDDFSSKEKLFFAQLLLWCTDIQNPDKGVRYINEVISRIDDDSEKEETTDFFYSPWEMLGHYYETIYEGDDCVTKAANCYVHALFDGNPVDWVTLESISRVELEGELNDEFEKLKAVKTIPDSLGESILGVCYGVGLLVEKNKKECAKHLLNAILINGERLALFYASYLLENDFFSGFDEEIQELKKALQIGDRMEDLYDAIVSVKTKSRITAESYYRLGLCYETGIKKEKDLKKAADCYEKSAKLGVSSAMFSLGLFYEFGYGVKRNLKQASYYFRMARDRGDMDAQNALKRTEQKELDEARTEVKVEEPVKMEVEETTEEKTEEKTEMKVDETKTEEPDASPFISGPVVSFEGL